MKHAADSTCHLPDGGEIRVRVELLTMNTAGHASVAGLAGGQIHPILSAAARDASTAIIALAVQVDPTRVREEIKP